MYSCRLLPSRKCMSFPHLHHNATTLGVSLILSRLFIFYLLFFSLLLSGTNDDAMWISIFEFPPRKTNSENSTLTDVVVRIERTDAPQERRGRPLCWPASRGVPATRSLGKLPTNAVPTSHTPTSCRSSSSVHFW